MILSLIGMTGSGKSHWSKKLNEAGFKCYCIDNLIEEKLGDELKRLGLNGIADVAKWMGQPYDKQYANTSKTYLAFEKEIMKDVLSNLENRALHDTNIVIDTTGSVIYIGDSILQKLKKLTRVVYLETPKSVQDEMYRIYINDPKPVIWGDAFSIKSGESKWEALARSYPELLAFRTMHYQKLAQKTFDYRCLRTKTFSVDTFISEII